MKNIQFASWKVLHLYILIYSISGRSFNSERSYTSHEDHRHSILKTVEGYLERMGGFSDGHSCVLRAICEVSISDI